MAAPVSLSCDAGLRWSALRFFGLEHATKSICAVRLELRSIDIACSSFLIQHQRLPGRTAWLRIANERLLFRSYFKYSTYMPGNFSSRLHSCASAQKVHEQSLHRTESDLDHAQYGGTGSMGASYASSCRCNIAERFYIAGWQGGMAMG